MVLKTNEGYTIESAIRDCATAFDSAGLFYGHGTDNALDEASWLILFALGLSPAVAPDYARVLTRSEVEACNNLVTKRIEKRFPAAYLTGETWYAGHRIKSDQRALVPRSPIAELINHDFFGLLEDIKAPRILDLCTGGGCIAIACAYASKEARIDASDLSAEALALASENIAMHELEPRVTLLSGSLFEPVSDTYHLIISNPPYVDALDLGTMPEEYRAEPELGLAAGKDGLAIVRQILASSAAYLKDDGHLVVEVGNSAEALEQSFPDVPFHWIDFDSGGDGVFLLSKKLLMTHFV